MLMLGGQGRGQTSKIEPIKVVLEELHLHETSPKEDDDGISIKADGAASAARRQLRRLAISLVEQAESLE